jgi:PhnB protein
MQVDPYLFFLDGICEEALTHYAGVFGGEIVAMHRYGDMPADAGHPPMPDEFKTRVMHARLETPVITIMGSDGRPGSDAKGGNISLSISTLDPVEGERVFNALSEGGKVEMPLADQFWGARFGQFTDRFGIDWMVNIELAPTAAHT